MLMLIKHVKQELKNYYHMEINQDYIEKRKDE